MRKLLLGITRPQSDAMETEYNAWYDNVHLPSVAALPGFKSGKRYKASAAQLFDGHSSNVYLAIYELEDEALAIKSLQNNPDIAAPSPTVHPDMTVIVFEEIAD